MECHEKTWNYKILVLLRSLNQSGAFFTGDHVTKRNSDPTHSCKIKLKVLQQSCDKSFTFQVFQRSKLFECQRNRRRNATRWTKRGKKLRKPLWVPYRVFSCTCLEASVALTYSQSFSQEYPQSGPCFHLCKTELLLISTRKIIHPNTRGTKDRTKL